MNSDNTSLELQDQAGKTLSQILKADIEQAQITFTRAKIHEFELHGEQVNLCRTYFSDSYAAKAVDKQKQAKSTVNHLSPESTEQMVRDLKAGLEASPEDSAYAILNSSEQKNFLRPLRDPDMEGLLESVQNFVAWTREHHPQLKFKGSLFKFIQAHQVLLNSQGLSLVACEDYYDGFVMFSGKQGAKTSSFNYTSFLSHEVPAAFQERSGLGPLLELSSRELEDPIPAGNFQDLVITPYCLPSFLSYLLRELSTGSLISKTSIFRGKLGEKILSDKIHLFCEPCADHFPSSEPYTADGVLTETGSLFEGGVLKNYLLDLYGSRKLDHPPTPFTGSHLVMKSGSQSLNEMISGIERGLLLGRFSGGAPSANGDFSGVAKNSFFIRDGVIAGPVRETMISGNMIRLLSQVRGISRESVHTGSNQFPWVHCRLD